MKKLLLSLALVFGVLSLSAAPVTVDFATADGLPTDDASTEVATATIGGVDFSFFHCKKGTYQQASYLQVSGKKYNGDDAAYVSFTSPIAAKSITVHTGSNASTNVTVQLYAGSTAIGEAVKLETKDANFTFSVPEANQVAGTVFKLQTTNEYNAQLTSITISDEAGTVEPPVVEPPVVEWNPTPGAETASYELKTATDIDGTHNEATDNAAENYQPLNSLKLGDFTFTFTTTNENKSSAPAFYYSTVASGKDECTIRNYAQTTMTVTAPADITMRTITFKGSSGKEVDKLTASEGTLNPANTASKIEWAGETQTVAFTFAGTFRIASMEVTYDNNSPIPASEAPVFSQEAGDFSEPFALTIAAAEGAKIYYTLDGTQPTADSDEYTAPIAISNTTTVKAVALEEGKRLSPVATATYTLVETYTALKEFAEAGLADTKAVVKFSGEATVVYQNGPYLYLTDATAPLLAYGTVNQTYQPGDVITGFAGSMTVYNNLNELNVLASSFGEPVKTVAAPEAKTMDVEDITAADQNMFVRIQNVKVVATTTDENKTNYTLVDQKDADIVAYPRFTDVTFPPDDVEYNVYGLVSVYKEDIQIFPIRFVLPINDSVEAIGVANGDAIYYNLQGQRVAAPAKGQLVIKVQADKAQKIIF